MTDLIFETGKARVLPSTSEVRVIGTGFSLWVFVLAENKSLTSVDLASAKFHRLKPMSPCLSQFFCNSVWLLKPSFDISEGSGLALG
jgi:hypothetical protein